MGSSPYETDLFGNEPQEDGAGYLYQDDMVLLPTPSPEDATGTGDLAQAIAAMLGIELDPWDADE